MDSKKLMDGINMLNLAHLAIYEAAFNLPELGEVVQTKPDTQPDYTCPKCGESWHDCMCRMSEAIPAANAKLREKDERIEELEDLRRLDAAKLENEVKRHGEARAELATLQRQPQPGKVADLITELRHALGNIHTLQRTRTTFNPEGMSGTEDLIKSALNKARSLDVGSVNRALLEASEEMRAFIGHELLDDAASEEDEVLLARWDAAIAAAKEAL